MLFRSAAPSKASASVVQREAGQSSCSCQSERLLTRASRRRWEWCRSPPETESRELKARVSPSMNVTLNLEERMQRRRRALHSRLALLHNTYHVCLDDIVVGLVLIRRVAVVQLNVEDPSHAAFLRPRSRALVVQAPGPAVQLTFNNTLRTPTLLFYTTSRVPPSLSRSAPSLRICGTSLNFLRASKAVILRSRSRVLCSSTERDTRMRVLHP